MKQENELNASSSRNTSSTASRSSSTSKGENGEQKPKGTASPVQFPTLSLPKGGGAIQGIDEKFQANPVTGTGSMSVPIAISPGRSGFAPQLALSYDSGLGDGTFSASASVLLNSHIAMGKANLDVIFTCVQSLCDSFVFSYPDGQDTFKKYRIFLLPKLL